MSGRGLRYFLCLLTLLPILLVLANAIFREDAAGQNGADPSVVGQWSPLVDVGMEGIHEHLLPTGKVLIYGYHTDDPYKDSPRIWDPATGTITRVDVPQNLFCSGHSFVADGRLRRSQ